MAGRLLAGALLLLACGGVRPAAACAPNGDDKVTIGGDTYVCVVVNFKTYMVAVPKAASSAAADARAGRWNVSLRSASRTPAS